LLKTPKADGENPISLQLKSLVYVINKR